MQQPLPSSVSNPHSEHRFPAPSLRASLSGTFTPSIAFRHLHSEHHFPAPSLRASFSGTGLHSEHHFPAPATPSIAFRHLHSEHRHVFRHLQLRASLSGTFLQTLPDHISYVTEGALFISAQLSTDAVSVLQKVRVLIKLQALVYDILPSTTAVFSYAIGP